MATFNLVVGDKLLDAVSGNVSEIVAIKGRWVEIQGNSLDTMNISRAEALAARNNWLAARNDWLATHNDWLATQDDGACEVCGDTAAILRDGQVACKTCCNNADLDAKIESDDDLNPETLDEIGARARGKSIVDPAYVKSYVAVKQTASTNRTAHCGDEIATILVGVDVDVLVRIAAKFSGQDRQWSHLNVGQRSMNARNVIRNSIKKLAADGFDGVATLRSELQA